MTNNSPFDNQIKKQLGNYQPAVPPHIWEKIMAKKEKEKPAGFFFFLRNNKFIFIALAFLLIVVGGLLLNKTYNASRKTNLASSNQPVAAEESAIAQKNIAKNLNAENKGQVNHISENKKGDGQSNPESQNVQPNERTSVSVNRTGENHIQGSPVDHSGTATSSLDHNDTKNTVDRKLNTEKVKRANALGKGKTTQQSSTTKSIGTENVIVENRLTRSTTRHSLKKKFTQNKTSVKIADPDATEETAEKISEENKKKIKKFAGKSSLSIQNPGTELATDPDIATKNAETNLQNQISTTEENSQAPKTLAAQSDHDFFMKNHYLTLGKTSAEKEISLSIKNNSLRSLDIPYPAIPAGKRYFEIYGGPDYAFRILSDTANSTYLQKRKESTHLSSAYSFGVRYTRVFNNSVSIRTGINFSQVNEKFKFEQGNIVQMIDIIDPNGDSTGSYATTGSRYKTTHNRYRTLDIPLQVGYELSKGKFGVNINAGLMINIYSWQKGDVLDTTFQPVNITTGKSSSPYQFKTNAGIGVTGGISFYYRLAGKISVLAEPYFRYNFSAANKSDITLRQKYTTAGLRMGLRMDF
ncbi:MAG: hypothetical protein ABIT58_08905 [Ferruginibacter sp.]